MARVSRVQRALSLVVIALFLGALMVCGVHVGGGALQAQPKPFKTGEKPSDDRRLIDLKADIVYPHKVNADSTVMCLVGNFAAQHNGAIITADSAVRYSDQRLECFGNVLINKNTTYAYADRADYNGVDNLVTLYAPIVKVVDEGTTMYTYNFTFNTLDNVGEYWGGGIMHSKENRMESLRGYFYADLDELVGVGDVELHTETYDLKGDSVRYNMQTEFAQYFENTNIWNEKSEYLYADRGTYDSPLQLHAITRNGYILTKEQELWSDSMDYFEAREEVIMRSNIQIDDTTNKTLAYGDEGRYWSALERAMLTKRPMVVNYDKEQGDSLFMKADTIMLVSRSFGQDFREEKADSLAKARHIADSTAKANFKMDSLRRLRLKADSLRQAARVVADSVKQAEVAKAEKSEELVEQPEVNEVKSEEIKSSAPMSISRPKRGESIAATPLRPATKRSESMPQSASKGSETVETATPQKRVVDTLAVDRSVVDTLAKDTTKLLTPKEIEAKAKAEAKRLKEEERVKEREAVSLKRIEARKVKIEAQKARATRAEAKRRERLIARAAKRGKVLTFDDEKVDSLAKDSMKMDSLRRDSLAQDSLQRDSLAQDSLAVDTVEKDTVYRLIKGFRNVRSYRTDFQSVSDSMVNDSRDTTLHLYINPILWNSGNQITAQEVDVYTRAGELHHAHFTGEPIMASQIDTLGVDTIYFNQVMGKEMTAFMRNNEIYRNDVDGNVQTIYFVQDEKSKEVTTMAVIESGSASFYIKGRQMEGISYRTEPTYTFYPLDLVPATQSLKLKGFEWHAKSRPVRDEFSDRKQRPTQRKEKSALPRPKFPIQEAMHQEMEMLIRDNVWFDREDVVAPVVEEWFNELGYKSGQPRPKESK